MKYSIDSEQPTLNEVLQGLLNGSITKLIAILLHVLLYKLKI